MWLFLYINNGPAISDLCFVIVVFFPTFLLTMPEGVLQDYGLIYFCYSFNMIYYVHVAVICSVLYTVKGHLYIYGGGYHHENMPI